MRTYTLKETSKIINVPTSKIKQWEKDLSGLLTIPRSKQGARIYSEIEIDLLLEIKHWASNNLGKAEIRELLLQQQFPSDSASEDPEKAIPILSDDEGWEMVTPNFSDDEDLEMVTPSFSDEENLEMVTSSFSDEEDLEMVTSNISDKEDLEMVTPSFSEDNLETTIPVFSSKEKVSEVPTELSKWDQEEFFLAMDQYKKTFLNEVKDEIRSVVRTEVMEEVKKEISNANYYTVKSLSDSLYKTSAYMQDEIKELSFTVQKATDLTDKTFNKLEKTISHQSLETSEELYSISKQLAETSEELSHYIDVTNNEITTLSETLEAQHEYFIEDREKFRNEVKQREIAFQGMLASYREAAATKEKKWWKFW